MSAAPAQAQALDNNIILQATGRPNGPDFALNNDKIPFKTDVSTITSSTTITEVLNIVAFLCNTTRTESMINDKHSISKETYGEHDDKGMYTNSGTGGAGGAGDTLFASASTGPLFDLNTMTAAAAVSSAVIPQGLLKRQNDNPGTNTSDINTANDPVAVGTQEAVNDVMKDCITQMITILEECRDIFGPKGWSKLYGEMSGGGGANKNHIKRTHRQHRRRYSSKQY
jgi:hypothetical protein